MDFAPDRELVGQRLEEGCDRYLHPGLGAVGEAIRYSLLAPGKRMRAVLLLAAYRAAGGRADASGLGAAVEVVHAYSLVHDDLPCMDDDHVRRGQPTTHRVYGPAAAAVAGIAMVPLAARWAFGAASELGLPATACAGIVRELMRASGAGGMVGGQLLDLAAEGRELTLDQLETMHRAKTGALIVTSVRLAGVAAGALPEHVHAFDRYGDAIGLAFQIADDVLDATATTAELGKTAGRDAAMRKSTYPALLGVGGARARATALVDEACSALASAGLLTAALEAMARFAVARRS